MKITHAKLREVTAKFERGRARERASVTSQNTLSFSDMIKRSSETDALWKIIIKRHNKETMKSKSVALNAFPDTGVYDIISC